MDPQNSLISGSAFPQQGTVDWGQLASRIISFSLDVLSRFSAANIDSYTLHVGQIICTQFELSPVGHKNVEKALRGLVSYQSFGDALWFGFGTRHIVRSMPMTEQGFVCLALCGVLSEYYHHESVAAEVFNEMVKALNTPPQFTPSILQWSSLLHGC